MRDHIQTPPAKIGAGDSCARQRGYQSITLRTHSVLTTARRVHEGAGFRLRSSEAKRNFGQDVVSEHWDLLL
jgi:hypothetical protein